jgi:hypothetical protein
MEDRLWSIVLRIVPESKPDARRRYSDRRILLVILWAVLHDRPISWACRAEHWPVRASREALPHPSTVSRRSRSASLRAAFAAAQAAFVAELREPSQIAVVDGKPLLVSDYSRDPDATNGHSMRRFGRGYKLHAAVDERGVVLASEVLPINVQERAAAARIVPSLAGQVRRVFADGNYDGAPLHRRLEGTGLKLYCPLINNYAGPRTHPRRKVLYRLMNHAIGEKIAVAREHVERRFALLGNLGFGLKGLPNWVRRLHRVRQWVEHKLLLYHAYMLLQAESA